MSSQLPLRVVACDDHAHITCTLEMALRKAGFVVETYPSGELALEAIQRETPAVIITDCQMPGGMDGLQLCRIIRGDSRFWDVPIIMLTSKGYELSENMLRRDLQISALIGKPFSPRELIKLVQSLVGVENATV
ncbi:MAG: response regulator [Planctomycetota bacterium]|nr:MAG: response regulator [Planctomycetota bacterium]